MESRIDRAREIIEREALAVRQVAAQIGPTFLRAIDLILGLRGRVVTAGMGKAGFIAQKISAIENRDIPVGTLDITLHRDDLRFNPIRPLVPSLMPQGGIEGRDVILVDDVLFSGRTIRAALDALGSIGRPPQGQPGQGQPQPPQMVMMQPPDGSAPGPVPSQFVAEFERKGAKVLR